MGELEDAILAKMMEIKRSTQELEGMIAKLLAANDPHPLKPDAIPEPIYVPIDSDLLLADELSTRARNAVLRCLGDYVPKYYDDMGFQRFPSGVVDLLNTFTKAEMRRWGNCGPKSVNEIWEWKEKHKSFSTGSTGA